MAGSGAALEPTAPPTVVPASATTGSAVLEALAVDPVSTVQASGSCNVILLGALNASLKSAFAACPCTLKYMATERETATGGRQVALELIRSGQTHLVFIALPSDSTANGSRHHRKFAHNIVDWVTQCTRSNVAVVIQSANNRGWTSETMRDIADRFGIVGATFASQLLPFPRA